MTSPFNPVSGRDLIDLVLACPLAWLVTVDASGATRVALPLFAETDDAQNLKGLVGHIPLAHPARQSLAAASKVLILFSGPNGYASPSWYPDRTSAPTWLYASAEIEARLNFDDMITDYALKGLVSRMEAYHGGDWTTAEMGERYEKLKSQVIGFKAEILSVKSCFRFGQNESDDISRAMAEYARPATLRAWVRRFNAGRTGAGKAASDAGAGKERAQ
ncbi:FMN-binding negative transcriptional regulator [Hyphomonas sp. NPDC076900]|uniref:FMN-binding negative transcriptional regulator n=1 Tax=unclassified Hyphomonas TaxID=2630699 RepID=UPI003D04D948